MQAMNFLPLQVLFRPAGEKEPAKKESTMLPQARIAFAHVL